MRHLSRVIPDLRIGMHELNTLSRVIALCVKLHFNDTMNYIYETIVSEILFICTKLNTLYNMFFSVV